MKDSTRKVCAQDWLASWLARSFSHKSKHQKHALMAYVIAISALRRHLSAGRINAIKPNQTR